MGGFGSGRYGGGPTVESTSRKRPIINFRPFERAIAQAAHLSKRAPCFPLGFFRTARAYRQWLFQDRPAISIPDHLEKTRHDNPLVQKPICEWELCHMKACAPGRGHRGPERYEQNGPIVWIGQARLEVCRQAVPEPGRQNGVAAHKAISTRREDGVYGASKRGGAAHIEAIVGLTCT